MKKYKDLLTGTLVLAFVGITSLSSVKAELVPQVATTTDTSIELEVTGSNGAMLSSGSHTNQTEININWDDVVGANSYNIYAWSETKAPSVRLLATEPISAEATPTVLTTSEYDTDFLREGNYYFAVKALDSNGVVLETSPIIGLTYDKTPPKVLVINPKYDQEIIGNSLIANGTISDANLDYYYFILRDSSRKTILTSTHISESVINDVIANLDISTYLSGSYDIAFVARDKAGNQTFLTDTDQTASFIVLRKGDSNSFSNPPRPIEPKAEVVESALNPASTEVNTSNKFKLVSNQNVLGVTSSTNEPSLNKLMEGVYDTSNTKIYAVAKAPVKQSHDVLYLALIPIAFCAVLVYIEKRQLATAKSSVN